MEYKAFAGAVQWAANGEAEKNNRLVAKTIPRARKQIITPSGAWIKTWTPPRYLINGILQQRFLYALTAPAGAGKTALALTLAAHVATGLPIGDHRVKQGRVLYLAGENPDDIMTRWLTLSEVIGFAPADVPVDFVPGVQPLKDIRDAVGETEYALVIVDTDQAYFDGDEADAMNSNTERKKWAQKLRQLTTLPGGPCVVVLAHPPKDARSAPYRPYGGNAFLNEIDANLYADRKGDGIILLTRDPMKFRGPEFAALPFRLQAVWSTELTMEDGTPVQSIRAVPLTAEDYQASSVSPKDEENKRLRKLWEDNPGLSLSGYAKLFGFDDPMNKGKSHARHLIDKWRKA